MPHVRVKWEDGTRETFEVDDPGPYLAAVESGALLPGPDGQPMKVLRCQEIDVEKRAEYEERFRQSRPRPRGIGRPGV